MISPSHKSAAVAISMVKRFISGSHMKIKKQKINYWAPMLLETDKNNKP
jgi:ribosomal protein L31E